MSRGVIEQLPRHRNPEEQQTKKKKDNPKRAPATWLPHSRREVDDRSSKNKVEGPGRGPVPGIQPTGQAHSSHKLQTQNPPVGGSTVGRRSLLSGAATSSQGVTSLDSASQPRVRDSLGSQYWQVGGLDTSKTRNAGARRLGPGYIMWGEVPPLVPRSRSPQMRLWNLRTLSMRSAGGPVLAWSHLSARGSLLGALTVQWTT